MEEEFEISEFNSKNKRTYWFISVINGALYDSDVAEALGLLIGEYHRLFESVSDDIYIVGEEYFFKKEEDAKKMLSIVRDLYIQKTVMDKLTENN